jgi:ribose transport system substrate-binding protein
MKFFLTATLSLAALLSATSLVAAAPKTVSGPGAEPACFQPWDKKTSYFQWPKAEGPYKIAVVNGFVGNLWRIQMVQTAKAFVEQPEIKSKISSFKIVSTGNDAAAQLGAIEDFINQGYNAIIVDAVSPEGFDRVIRLADKNNVVIVPFDNTLDTDKVMQVNEDQYEMGRQWGAFLAKELGDKKDAKVLEVRGVPGNSVDRDRHEGIAAGMKEAGANWKMTQVVGNWDDGTAQKVVADAIAVNGHFDAVTAQGGDTGVVQALAAANHPWIPFAGESENGFRKAIAAHSAEGLKGISIGQSPGLVAISIKAAISALEGNKMPKKISVPLPQADYTTLKDGENYWSKLPDNFFTVNEFPPCNVNITATEIMSHNEQNQ